MLLSVRHEATLRFPSEVGYSIQQLRLTPRAEPRQRLIDWRVAAPGKLQRVLDAFGNIAHMLTVNGAHREVSVVVSSTVETDPAVAAAPDAECGAVPCDAYLAPTALTVADAALAALARSHFAPGHDAREAAWGLISVLTGLIEFDARAATCGAQQALSQRRAGAPDFVHALLACCRAAGVPARYVSGFVAGDSVPSGEHAWLDLWLPESGWIGFDPVGRCHPDDGYCRLAVGRDAMDACPVRVAGMGGDLATACSIETVQ